VIVIAVPVKDLGSAKQRLMPVLDAPQRAALARAMLADVLRALAAADAGRVWVVTRDPEVAAIARGFGAEVVDEAASEGHTAAVARAQARAVSAGATTFATVPGDVPCVRADEIRRLVAAVVGRSPAIALAPSRSGLGTNGAALSPPAAMPLTFGEPSFARHVAAARARGIEPEVLALPGLGLDVDGPEDLRALALEGATTEAGRLAAGWPLPAAPRPPRYEIVGVTGIAEVRPGDDLARIVAAAAARQDTPIRSGDLLVISQKVVSKAEGRLVHLPGVSPSPGALAMAAQLDRDARLVEVILRESRRIVRMDRGVLIAETHHGWVCANAGVDQSNVDRDWVTLLPEDADRSARVLRERLREALGVEVAVIVADTFGRPWREGLTNVAIGVSGLAPLTSYLGARDPAGRELQATVLALADELAAAAEPVMGKLARIPVAIVRGLAVTPSEEGSKPLRRDPARDLFR
jgi:coenzyme F420-0:L-glutamate ligase/coenzyme F420-1:gamma-L-glutamate ligase